MKRIAALVILVVALAGLAGIATSDAKALNPLQTTPVGVVNKELPDLNTFWTTNFRNWGWSQLWRNTGVGFYNPGPYSGYASACGSTSGEFFFNNAVYCTGDYSIYMDQTWVQRLLNRYGDGGPAMILAHEYGHHISHLQGRFVNKKPVERELNADCLAGMYFKWGIVYSRVLHSNDYSEARTLIWTSSEAIRSDTAQGNSGWRGSTTATRPTPSTAATPCTPTETRSNPPRGPAPPGLFVVSRNPRRRRADRRTTRIRRRSSDCPAHL